MLAEVEEQLTAMRGDLPRDKTLAMKRSKVASELTRCAHANTVSFFTVPRPAFNGAPLTLTGTRTAQSCCAGDDARMFAD